MIQWIFLHYFIGVQLLYNVVLISTVQQSESVIPVCISSLFGASFPFRSILWSFAIELEWSQIQFHPLSSVQPFTSVAPAVSGTCPPQVHSLFLWAEPSTHQASIPSLPISSLLFSTIPSYFLPKMFCFLTKHTTGQRGDSSKAVVAGGQIDSFQGKLGPQRLPHLLRSTF